MAHKQDHPKYQISLIEYVANRNTPEARKFIQKFGQLPAKNMPELKTRMAYVVKEFKGNALKELVKIHPDRELINDYSKMTGEKTKDGYLYSNCYGDGDCPGGNNAADGSEGKCKCDKCKQKSIDDTHSNFITNFREGGLQCADGSTSRLDTRTVDNLKTGAKVLLGVSAVFLLGWALVAHGEKTRTY